MSSLLLPRANAVLRRSLPRQFRSLSASLTTTTTTLNQHQQHQRQRQQPQTHSFSSTAVATTNDDDDYIHTKNSKNKYQNNNIYNQPLPAGPPGGYALVHHGHAYETAMAGLHGQQLEKAQLEGEGKDDDPFDPFLEDELTEERLMIEQMQGKETQEEEQQDNDDDFEQINEDDLTHEEKYQNDGSLRRTNAQKAILRAGWPAGGMFAIVRMAGSQFKVVQDDVLIVNRLKPVRHWSVGSVHTLRAEDVLLLGTTHYTLVGLPYVRGAQVDVMVEEITKGEKVVIFKKRRRKHSQRKNGFRRDVTMLRILAIRPPASLEHENYRARIETEYKPLPEDYYDDDGGDDYDENEPDEEFMEDDDDDGDKPKKVA